MEQWFTKEEMEKNGFVLPIIKQEKKDSRLDKYYKLKELKDSIGLSVQGGMTLIDALKLTDRINEEMREIESKFFKESFMGNSNNLKKTWIQKQEDISMKDFNERIVEIVHGSSPTCVEAAKEKLSDDYFYCATGDEKGTKIYKTKEEFEERLKNKQMKVIITPSKDGIKMVSLDNGDIEISNVKDFKKVYQEVKEDDIEWLVPKTDVDRTFNFLPCTVNGSVPAKLIAVKNGRYWCFTDEGMNDIMQKLMSCKVKVSDLEKNPIIGMPIEYLNNNNKTILFISSSTSLNKIKKNVINCSYTDFDGCWFEKAK